jgi:hypothetical protein
LKRDFSLDGDKENSIDPEALRHACEAQDDFERAMALCMGASSLEDKVRKCTGVGELGIILDEKATEAIPELREGQEIVRERRRTLNQRNGPETAESEKRFKTWSEHRDKIERALKRFCSPPSV